jgi:hypothetical protein
MKFIIPKLKQEIFLKKGNMFEKNIWRTNTKSKKNGTKNLVCPQNLKKWSEEIGYSMKIWIEKKVYQKQKN